jgi:predicted GIY-YIG superfamily endonuclease
MSANEERLKRLLEKANTLPLCPGVYIMKNASDKVIYVGKSRKLKSRVSQYFQNSAKNVKTHRMVSSVENFDYIVCNTEIEALTLENTLIKQYSPKYNIKLKDARSYPYIKITNEEYPRVIFTRTRMNDRAKYFALTRSSLYPCRRQRRGGIGASHGRRDEGRVLYPEKMGVMPLELGVLTALRCSRDSRRIIRIRVVPCKLFLRPESALAGSGFFI